MYIESERAQTNPFNILIMKVITESRLQIRSLFGAGLFPKVHFRLGIRCQGCTSHWCMVPLVDDHAKVETSVKSRSFPSACFDSTRLVVRRHSLPPLTLDWTDETVVIPLSSSCHVIQPVPADSHSGGSGNGDTCAAARDRGSLCLYLLPVRKMGGVQGIAVR